MRTFAIGDIHGSLTALDALLKFVSPGPSDRVITLGDYVDRGPDSRGVLDRLIRLGSECELIPLRGNHEEIMLYARRGGRYLEFWLRVGGREALASYGEGGEGAELGRVPAAHWDFIDNVCRDWYETERHICVHASVDGSRPMEEQNVEWLRWGSLDAIRPHVSGKVVVCGHTEQRDGSPVYLGHAIGIDTWAYSPDGWLTCLELNTGRYWQANNLGQTRDGWLDSPD